MYNIPSNNTIIIWHHRHCEFRVTTILNAQTNKQKSFDIHVKTAPFYPGKKYVCIYIYILIYEGQDDKRGLEQILMLHLNLIPPHNST